MGVRIFIGKEQGSDIEQAVLLCSTTDTAFGPVFASEAEAEGFLRWLAENDGRDARELHGTGALEGRVSRFRSEVEGYKTWKGHVAYIPCNGPSTWECAGECGEKLYSYYTCTEKNPRHWNHRGMHFCSSCMDEHCGMTDLI